MGHGCARRLGGVQAPNGAACERLWLLPSAWGAGQSVEQGAPGTAILTLLSVFQHNLCCDNCHSHVALALNLMRYDNSTSWNMVKLCFFSLLYGKYVR